MSKQFTPGKYKTRGGQNATVYKLAQKGTEWELVGAVHRGNVSYLTGWTIMGKSLYRDFLDLLHPEDVIETKSEDTNPK